MFTFYTTYVEQKWNNQILIKVLDSSFKYKRTVDSYI